MVDNNNIKCNFYSLCLTIDLFCYILGQFYGYFNDAIFVSLFMAVVRSTFALCSPFRRSKLLNVGYCAGKHMKT